MRRHTGHQQWVRAICAFRLNGISRLATCHDETVWIWDPETGVTRRTLIGHTNWVNAICAFTLNGTTLLATASYDKTVRLWDPGTGANQRTLVGHTSWVNAICSLTLNGITLLATAGNDGTVRIWSPLRDTSLLILPTRNEALSIACSGALLFVGMTTGMLAIWLDPEFLSRSLQ